jgi:uncharacterized protein (TIGR02466 family)
MPEIHSLFPIPVMRAPNILNAQLVGGLIDHFSREVNRANSSSAHLSHTALLKPGDSPLLVDVAKLLTPLLPEFGALLLGERIGWSLKEMWVNVLDKGGRQAMHNHANSFISGVVYLTHTHPDSRTVFMKSPGGTDFAFRNDHAGVDTNAFNADKWISPAPEPGDVMLFPSFLMHAVPLNPGERRISLAFNAIPTHLDSWGYRISFAG